MMKFSVAAAATMFALTATMSGALAQAQQQKGPASAQAQLPSTHCWPKGQTVPHAPQFAASTFTSVQVLHESGNGC